MDIEQTSPNKPNFLLVVILAAVSILILFVLAYFFLDFEGGHIRFHHQAHPTSRLMSPGGTGMSMDA